MDRTHSPEWRMTVDEYLALEARSPVRHEYVGGVAYAIAGASLRHSRIALNVAAHLRDVARARGCAVVLADVKVRAAQDRFYYPDVLVACGQAAEVELVVEQPSLIAEVTSPSTRATDRREKLDAYLRIPSLQAYLIVDQRRRHVLAYTRDAGGAWRQEELPGAEAGEVPIPFLGARLTVDQIYEDVTLPPLAVREGEEWEDDEWADDGEGRG